MSAPTSIPSPLANDSPPRSISPRNPRKYTIRNQRQAWTHEEHSRFVEGIHLYKRDWSRVTAHVGTRTVVQIRSHAQKHFIKLKRQGKENLIPPRRNKDRRDDGDQSYENLDAQVLAEHYAPQEVPAYPPRKRSFVTYEEKSYNEARESKDRPVKRVKPMSPLQKAMTSPQLAAVFAPDQPPSYTLKNHSNDIHGIQALLLLASQG